MEVSIEMSKLEQGLQNKIVKWLKENHIWHFRYTASTTFGIPDIVCLYKGKFVGIEVKRPDGKGVASKLQEKMIESINKNGGIATTVESLQEVVDIFESID